MPENVDITSEKSVIIKLQDTVLNSYIETQENRIANEKEMNGGGDHLWALN